MYCKFVRYLDVLYPRAAKIVPAKTIKKDFCESGNRALVHEIDTSGDNFEKDTFVKFQHKKYNLFLVPLLVSGVQTRIICQTVYFLQMIECDDIKRTVQ